MTPHLGSFSHLMGFILLTHMLGFCWQSYSSVAGYTPILVMFVAMFKVLFQTLDFCVSFLSVGMTWMFRFVLEVIKLKAVM